MKRLIYVIGQPGVGKTTAVNAALGQPESEHPKPFYHLFYADGAVCQLGRLRDDFSGTDALSMSVQPIVEEWLRTHQVPTIVAEGDRLANGKFFASAQMAGYKLELVYLSASYPVLESRRRERGSSQNPAWLAGRRSKVQRLVAAWKPTHYIDGERSVDQVAQALRNVIWLDLENLMNCEDYVAAHTG